MRARGAASPAALWALVLVLVFGSGCYRTHYVNFSGANPARAGAPTPKPEAPIRVSGWQSFFVYGWAPGERRIDAVTLCGTARNIESVRTRRKFIQGLIGAFAGYYINIYSPWDGAVYCVEHPFVAKARDVRDDPAPVSAARRSDTGGCEAACDELAPGAGACSDSCR